MILYRYTLNMKYFLLFLSLHLFADIDEYFRKIENKPTFDQMRNIDFVYMINLDERPEKYQSCEVQLALYGITPFRFSAINGWQLSLDVINDVGVKYHTGLASSLGSYFFFDQTIQNRSEPLHQIGRTYFCYDMRLGAIGCVLSHLSVLQDAYDSGYETIWIMEDDIDIRKNPHLLSDLIDELDAIVGKEGWDILYTDPDTKDKMGQYVRCICHAWRPDYRPPNPKAFQVRENVGSTFIRIGARYGTYSMIFRRSGIKKVLQFLKTYQIFLPYDMEVNLPPGIKLFSLQEDFVSTQPRAISDNGFPNFLNVSGREPKSFSAALNQE